MRRSIISNDRRSHKGAIIAALSLMLAIMIPTVSVTVFLSNLDNRVARLEINIKKLIERDK
jgi:hypothetical protein